jgi:hypothetical protein
VRDWQSFGAGKKLIRLGVNNGVLELGIGQEVYFDAQNGPWILAKPAANRQTVVFEVQTRAVW